MDKYKRDFYFFGSGQSIRNPVVKIVHREEKEKKGRQKKKKKKVVEC
jgi:hypothetical protein